MNESELEPPYINEKMSKKLLSISSSVSGERKGAFLSFPKPGSFLPHYLNQHEWFWSLPPFGPRSFHLSLFLLPSFLCLCTLFVWQVPLGTSKTMRTFSLSPIPSNVSLLSWQLNCLLNKTLTFHPNLVLTQFWLHSFIDSNAYQPTFMVG